MGNPFAAIPVIGGMFDNSDEQAMNELRKNRGLYDNLQTPDLKWKDYTPEGYKSDSVDYQTTEVDPRLKSSQQQVLARMAGLAENGLSDVDQAGYAQARDEGNQLAHAGTQSAIQDAQTRGVAGSGMEFALREAANQAGAQRASQSGLAQAADSARARAMYNTAYGNELGQQRNQDEQHNSANTDIINRFNQLNTQQRNTTNNANVDQRNEAFKYNQDGGRGVQQQNFNNQVTKVGGQAQANTGMAQGYAAQNAANTSNRNALTQVGAQAGMMAMGVPPVAQKKKNNGGS